MATLKPIVASEDASSPGGEKTRSRTGKSVLELIGNTPLLRLTRVGSEFPNVEFYAKAEWCNPGGSVKDRPALSMIQAGLAGGALRPGKIIIDATSGNASSLLLVPSLLLLPAMRAPTAQFGAFMR